MFQQDPDTALLLYHLESDARIQNLSRHHGGFPAPNPLMQRVRQVWQRVLSRMTVQAARPECCATATGC